MYLHDWKDGGFIDMVGDFDDIYITTAEYEVAGAVVIKAANA